MMQKRNYGDTCDSDEVVIGTQWVYEVDEEQYEVVKGWGALKRARSSFLGGDVYSCWLMIGEPNKPPPYHRTPGPSTATFSFFHASFYLLSSVGAWFRGDRRELVFWFGGYGEWVMTRRQIGFLALKLWCIRLLIDDDVG
ncbi:hypothetical protein RJT34_19971 [Clitoria ternatea]|uniref:Uncharacterized protein n=1 Tax=Clitoria ternatea TaxID=43366 RepID=A0AAN9IS59_CLITE